MCRSNTKFIIYIAYLAVVAAAVVYVVAAADTAAVALAGLWAALAGVVFAAGGDG